VLAPLFLGITGRSLSGTFLCLSGIFLVLGLASAAFMRNPPAGWMPTGRPSGSKAACPEGTDIPLRRAVLSGRFLLLWIVFFCNITAGIAIISFQSPLFQDLWKRVSPDLAPALLAGIGATLVAVSSLFNGAGRFLWGAVSDRIGRSQTFRIMLGSQIVVFAVLVLTANPWVFAVLVCWVLLCYGGGFGTMPSFICDVFGVGLMSAVYGSVLTAWAAAGIVGPQIFAALQDRLSPSSASLWSFVVAGGFALAGLVLSFLLSNAPITAPGKPVSTRPKAAASGGREGSRARTSRRS
jgi:OFA family oxalate/formate antiporter-like MFS transporter